MFNYHSYTEPREKYFVDENFICSSYPTSSEFLTNYQNKKFRKDIEENENPDPILKYNDISNNIVNDFLGNIYIFIFIYLVYYIKKKKKKKL